MLVAEKQAGHIHSLPTFFFIVNYLPNDQDDEMTIEYGRKYDTACLPAPPRTISPRLPRVYQAPPLRRLILYCSTLPLR
jgi:hypothetical protein